MTAVSVETLLDVVVPYLPLPASTTDCAALFEATGVVGEIVPTAALLVGFGVVFVHETKSPDSAPSTNQKITSIGRMNTALEGNTNAMTVLCSARM